MNYKELTPVPGRVILVFVAVLLAMGFLLIVAVATGLAPVATPSSLGRSPVFMIGVFYAGVLLAVGIAVLPMGRSALPALAFRSASWKPVVLGPLATLVLSIAVSQIGPEVESMKQVAELVRGSYALPAALLMLAVLAPLVEEIVFRGLLYGWLDGRWGWKAALPVSALAFAVAHFDPAYMILVLPLGILFSWLRWRTGSLLPSLVAHMINNGFAVLSAFWFS